MALTAMTAGSHYAASNGNPAGALAAFVKTRFPQRKIEEIVNFGQPTLSMLSRHDDLEGNTTNIPLEYSQPQGIGAQLNLIASSTINNITQSQGVQFALSHTRGYAMLLVDGITMMKMRSNEGSFFRTREHEMKGILTQLGNQLEMFLWQSGYGSLGTLNADPGTATTFTLATAADALNFHEGMYIVFQAASGSNPGGTNRAGGSRQVTAVNYSTGVITVSAALDAALGSGDHVVRAGNTEYTSAGDGLVGIPRWIPSSDPTDTLFGVARTNYPQKLGGHRQAWLGTIEETAKKLDSTIRRISQRPKTLWLSFANFHRLELELASRAYRMDDGKGATFNQPTLQMASPGGTITVKAGPYVPENAGFLLDMATWELHHLGGLPHLVTDDGNTALRIQNLYEATANASGPLDAIEMRYRWVAQLYCRNPFANGRFVIS